MIEFTCIKCNEVHEGVPTFGWNAPLLYLQIPEKEREGRCVLGSDDCIVDDSYYFVRGCIDIPVIGQQDVFTWGVWASLSSESYTAWHEMFHEPKRSHVGPFFGWLSTDIWLYPEQTLSLKTHVHLRDDAIRPAIELEPTDHLLAIEQRKGITIERLTEIYSLMTHGPDQETPT